MDRTGIIAVTLAIVVLVAWQIYYTRTYQTAPAPAPFETPAAEPTPVAAALPAPEVERPQPDELEEIEEITHTARTSLANYRFTNRGGGIAEVELLKHLAEHGENVKLNELGRVPIGAISEKPGEAAMRGYSFRQTEGGVIFERTGADGLEIVKRFSIPGELSETNEYIVGLEVSLTNRGASRYTSDGYFIYLGSAAAIHQRDLPTYTGLDWYREGDHQYIDVNWFTEGRVPLLGIRTRPARENYLEVPGNISWAAVKNQYFATVILPIDTPAKGVWASRFELDEHVFAVRGAVEMPGFALQPGEILRQEFSIYTGPKEYRRLTKLGYGLAEIMNFGMFKIISQFLLTSMNWLYGILNSYAAAILVLTIVIRAAMWPLQNKATNSMKKMQAIQPKMAELREKYKDDPTRMNQELMKLYKDYGINPFGGCLPMLVQIPIFFGFYSMLGTAVELRNSRFFWVEDLSQPDTIARIPGIDFPINILPLLMAATMVWQMALTPKAGDAVQQRVFMFMPLIFVVFCYNFASALALYWTAQNIFSIVQLYITRDKTQLVLQKKSAPAQTKAKKKSRGTV